MKIPVILYGFLITFFLCVTTYSEDNFHLITTMSGEQEGDGFSEVCGVGDVNGDGFDDVAVGAVSRGANYVKIYFGGSPFDTVHDLRFSSDDPYSHFGWSLAGGDYNGDGYSDLVVGAFAYNLDQYYVGGRVYMYYGGEDMDTIPDLIIKGQGSQYMFGIAVANGGDVNGDGYTDLLAGATDEFYTRGHVYIYYGGPQMDDVEDVVITGEDSDEIGEAIDGVGDVDQDGYDDILIGAPLGGDSEQGRAYLFYGGDSIGFDNAVIFNGDTSQYQFGELVSGIGDINNDGCHDFAIMGASNNSKVILGSKISSWQFYSFHSEIDYIGGIGDLNGDSYDDFVVVSNVVKFYFGGFEIDTIPEVVSELWTKPVVNLGDINGDSLVDIGRGRGGGWDPKGKVYIYTFGEIISINEDSIQALPAGFNLYQNYPNPFNTETQIEFKLEISYNVILDILSIRGQKISTLFSGARIPGTYLHAWNGKDDFGNRVPSGIYFCRLSVISGTKNHVDVKKMLFLK